jgi:hypothetical protein
VDKSFLSRLEDARPLPPSGASADASASLASVQDGAPVSKFPQRPATIFCPLAETHEPPKDILEYYFTKCTQRSSWKPQAESGGARGGSSASLAAADRSKPMLDPRRLNMLGIMVQKYLMEHKGESGLQAIINIKRSVLRCDYDAVRLEGLSVIRTVLRQHDKDGRPVCAFVRSYGEAALDKLEFADQHRLVYELSKVPQIDERLECMLFQLTFRESITTCQNSLCALSRTLETLNGKRDTIRRFFVTAHRLGMSLNRASRAPQAPRGFQLSTLEKMSQTKSTKFPRLSILHFVLALMRRDDLEALFNNDDRQVLQSTKAFRTHKVFQDCVELAQGIYGVQQICETGKYTCLETGQAVRIERRRKTLPPPRCLGPEGQGLDHSEPMVDTDDRFHDVMKEFVDSNLEAAEDVAEGALQVILTYSSHSPMAANPSTPRRSG